MIYQEYQEFMLKYIIVGDTNVGKSCLMYRYLHNLFDPSHTTTLGVDFGYKSIYMDGKLIKLQMWDTSGQERFKSIVNAYFRGAHVALLVFDVTKEDTFNNINEWLQSIICKTTIKPVIVLVGNKSDLPESDRKITKEMACEYAMKNNIEYIEISVKNSSNIDLLFTSSAKKALETFPIQQKIQNIKNTTRNNCNTCYCF